MERPKSGASFLCSKQPAPWPMILNLQPCLMPTEERGILSLLQTACALADDLEFAAVSHADRTEPKTRIAGCKGDSDRHKVLSRLPEIDRLVCAEVESLDF